MTAVSTAGVTSVTSVSPDLQHRVEQFLYAEAQLLDEHEFTAWIALFTEDAHYWMPTRNTRTNRERAKEISARGEAAHIDDDMVRLRGRVRRSMSGLAWSEEPPSRTRRVLGNVRIQERDTGELDVRLNFWVYRSRLERHQDWFVGERFDVLVPDDGPYGYRIADRKIVLDQATVLAPNISVFL
jgi:3-phenylpropionate/cinnamic acid dioxygenase small subunit